MCAEFTVSPEEIACACQGELPPLVVSGLALFNRGEYFEAHEVLETAWRAEDGPVRELYRGILQVGVAYYHIQRGNYHGALKMFKRSHTWLDPFPDNCRGIDLSAFRQDAGRVEAALRSLGQGRLDYFDHGLFHPIHFTSS